MTTIALVSLFIAVAGTVFGLFYAMSRADIRKIEELAVASGWKLKRVRWVPAWLVFGKFGDMKTYYRVILDAGSDEERLLWFESTFTSDPTKSVGPSSSSAWK